jgi:hypothetical protein
MTWGAARARLTRRGFLGAALASCVAGPRSRRRPRLSLEAPAIGRMARWAG